MRKAIEKGFTLIELMIVVAIIGVLASIAIAQYPDYTSRSRAAGAVSELSSIRASVATCLDSNNGVVASCDTLAKIGLAGGNALTQNVTSVATISALAAGIRLNATTGATASNGGAGLIYQVDYVPVAGRASTPWVNNGGTACNVTRGLRAGQGGC